MELIENEKKILAHIRKHGKTSKMTLAGEEGIQCAWATVSKLVNRLEKNALITKTGTDGISRRYGKNAYLYDLADKTHLTLGIDVEKTITTCQVLTLGGDSLFKKEVPTPESPSSKQLLNFLIKTIQACLSEAPYKKEALLGIGIGMPAQDLQHQKKSYSNLALVISEAVGLRTVANNNIHAYTNYYNLNGNEPNFYLIAIRTGVGGGFVVNHQLYEGLSFAGEIGHIPNQLEGGKVLESSISLPALKQWYFEQFKKPAPEVDTWGQKLQANDANLTALFSHFLKHLIPALELLIKILDVPKIIVASSWNVEQESMNTLLVQQGFSWKNRVVFENFDKANFVSASAFLIQKPFFL